MKDNASSNGKAVITMPIDFQTALFKPLEDDNFLLEMFNKNQALLDGFMSTLNQKACELSDDFDAGEWAIGREVDTECHTFFLYPKDNTKTYTVKGSELPSSPDCEYNDEHGYDMNGDEYDDVVVDNKVFGLIATLASFDTYAYSNDMEVIALYMDNGQDLNECIVEVEGDLKERMTTYSVELDRMMDIVWLFLRDRNDEGDDDWDDGDWDDDDFNTDDWDDEDEQADNHVYYQPLKEL